MAISDDWDFNFAAKVISHIDGVLSYDTGSGSQADVGDYVYGATSGALGKVLSRTGDTSSGTLTLTNVLGQFEDDELLEALSSLDFDEVQNANKSLIQVGATITGGSSSSTLVIKFIEYNIGGTAGQGTFYGTPMSAAFTDGEDLNISATKVAEAVGTGTDNDTKLGTTLVDGVLAVPGTANTNNCALVHYDGGTIAIPEDAHIQSATSTAEGYAQRVFGATTTGSIRVIDSDTTGGAWTNNETLRILDCEYYDSLVTGKVFSEGDIIQGGTSGYQARVLAVIDDGDSTGKLILAGNTGTPWTDGEDIEVRQADDTWVKYAEVETGQNSYLDAATLNLPNGARTLQRDDQGGIFPSASLNLVRSSNALYSYAQDLFDELGQLDDDPAFEGNVRDQLYTILNDYIIPDLSFRFLEKGSFKDSGNNNVFTNIQTTGAIADIGDHGYFYDSTNPTPQPDMYVEQDGTVARQDWLEGNLDILIKVKTSTDPRYINPSVNALGQLVDSAAFTVHLRPYRRTYDSNEVTQVGGIAVVAVGNANDLNNTTAQYTTTLSAGNGTAFVVGEEATTSDGKRVICMNAAQYGTLNTYTWALKSGTNLVATDVVTGSVSGATGTIGTVTDVVAGYDSDIRVMVVQRRFTGGTTSGTFILGELVTESTTNATGYFMEDDSGTIYIEEQDASTPFNGTYQLTGGTSGATNTPTATAVYSTVPKDIGGGVGDINYTAVVSADITDADPQTVQAVYEWWKFITRRESTYQVNLPGQGYDDYTEGRIYRRLQSTFAETRGASPFGLKAGSLVIGAQGVFIEKFTLDSGDIRNIQLVGNDGVTYDPPNLQVLEVTNLVSGVRAAVYRTASSGSETIQRTEFKVGAVGGGYNQSGDAYILIAAQDRSVSPIPNDVPDTGVLRVLDPNDTGDYLRFIYDEVDRTNNWFHLQQGVGQNTIGAVTSSVDLTANDNVHVVLIEEESSGASVNNTIQYVSDIYVFAVARIKGKQPFKTTSTFGSTGASIGAVLNPDNVVNLP